MPGGHQRLQPPREPSAEETRRILDGIHQINVQLGYIKPTPVKSAKSRQSSSGVNSAEGYFYPRPAYHPLNHMSARIAGAQLPAEPRYAPTSGDAKQARVLLQRTPTALIYFPVPYLELPRDVSSFAGRQGRQMIVDNGASDYFAFLNRARNQAGGASPADISREKAMLVSTVKKIVSDIKEGDRNRTQAALLDRAVLMGQLGRQTAAAANKQKLRKSQQPKAQQQQQQQQEPQQQPQPDQPQTSIIVVSPLNERRLAEYHSRAVGENITNTVKNFFTKPFKGRVTPAPAAPAAAPAQRVSPSPLLEMIMNGGQTKKPAVDEDRDDREDDDDEPDAVAKGPFSSYFENQKEQVVEALKQGGVIIQRLRVREGGIAIAGPNGVATAGSGGTAIVGPGGIALTHPRSLAIAGPGARVFAVPETTDLQELAMRSNARSLLDGGEAGVLVATGPIVYYNPDTADEAASTAVVAA